MSKSQHWYDRDGNAVFEVPKAKGGGTRPTTIADARKLNLYPSVTTVLSVLAKPSLDDWKLQQVAERAYSNPPQDGEEPSSYSRRIIDGAFEQVGEAADLGTRIHAAIEAHFKGEPVPDEMQVYVRPVVGALERTLHRGRRGPRARLARNARRVEWSARRDVEVADPDLDHVVAVVVSEETGAISLAENGVLVRGLSAQDLRNELRTRLANPQDKSVKSIWNVLKAHG